MLKTFVLFSCAVLFIPFCCFAHGDLHEQIQYVSKQIKQTPNNANLYLHRGQLYSQHNQLDSAIYDLKKAQRLNPDLIITHLILAEVFSKDHQPLIALENINEFLNLKPNNPDGLIIRAGIYRQLKRELTAKQDLQSVFSALKEPAPKHYIAITEACLRADSTNFEEALDWLKKGQNQFGFDIVLKEKEINLLVEYQEYSQALLAIDDLLNHFPRKEKWLFQKGQICEKANQSATALTHYYASLKTIQDLPKRIQMTRKMLDLEAKTIDRIQKLK